jgi:outer membrane protein assembly factor BamB
MTRNKVGWAAVAVVLVVALAGCWPAVGQNPDRTAANPFETQLTTGTVGGLRELWDTTIGAGEVGPPIVDGGGVIARSTQHSLARVDARSGAQVWAWQPPVDPPEFVSVSDPHIVDGRLLVGYGARNYWEASWVDPATGAELGDAPYGGLVRAVRGDLVLVESYIYGSLTPIAVWFGIVDRATGTSTGGLAAVVYGDPVPQWTLGAGALFNSGPGLPATADPNSGLNVVRAFPAADIDGTCGPPEYANLACPTWMTEVGSLPTAPVVGPGGATVYVGTAAGEVVALDAASGAVQWRAAVGAAVTEPPALAAGVLYVGTAAGRVVAVDADGCGVATCPTLWSAAVGSGAVATQPAVGGSGPTAVVYAATTSGDVASIAAAGCGRATCRRLWSGSVGADVSSGPIVSTGRVIVGTADGRLVAFGLPPR